VVISKRIYFPLIEEEYDFYKSNAEKIGSYASNFNGLDTATAIIEGIL